MSRLFLKKISFQQSNEQQLFFADIQKENAQLSAKIDNSLKFGFLSVLFYTLTIPFFKSYRLQIQFADKESRSFFYHGDPISIVAFWHEFLFIMIPFFSKYIIRRNIPILPLVSASADGEIIARILRPFGFTMIRGSSGKKGVQSIRMIQKALRLGFHTLLTPDGPRGPKHKIKKGLPFLAFRNNLPILPISATAHRDEQRPPNYWWRLRKSWDQTLIPPPFSKVCVKIGPIIRRKPAETFQDFSRHIENQMQNPVL